ncbi:hypothetical protein FRB99_005810 [Tulasnella sp. 403]|nr:hypothetical protein FRB99_005810 [Tulasnella sp. 403]
MDIDSRKRKATEDDAGDDYALVWDQLESLRLKLPREYQKFVIINRPERHMPQSSSSKPDVLVPRSPSPKRRKSDGPRPSAIEAAQQAVFKAGRIGGLQQPSTYDQLFLVSTTIENLIVEPRAISKPEFVPQVIRPSSMGASAAKIYSQNNGTPQIESGVDPTEDTDFSNSLTTGPLRDEQLAIIEKLEVGPIDHEPPNGDPGFLKVEPNSKINLSSRKMPHSDVQEFIRGRYYVSPSILYSIIRPEVHRQGYDVPVEGDWVTIAVVAERGRILVSQRTMFGADDRLDSDADDGNSLKFKRGASGTSPKKYVTMKLVDFGHKSASGTYSGDALLSLLLFEADSVSPPQRDADGKPLGTPLYKGGSGGAFEELLPKLREGTVLAILNARVLRPYQGKNNQGSTKPHPTSNILGITPTTAECIKIIGYSKDLGLCGVQRRDGTPCGSWCDRRRAEACEYHVLQAVKSKRASRPEFSASTSGMSTGPPGGRGSKTKFDANKKQGLLPSTSRARSDGAGSSYILSGHIVSTADSEYISERRQREIDDKLKKSKELSEKKDEELLRKLLNNDNGTVGAKAVEAARKYVRHATKEEMRKGNTSEKGAGKHSTSRSDDDELDEDALKGAERRDKLKRAAYKPDTMKKLGFDPTMRPGDVHKLKKLDPITLNQTPREFNLGPRPGPRIKSGVVIPEDKRLQLKDGPTPTTTQAEEDESDLEIECDSTKVSAIPPNDEPCSKEDSDSDLEIEPPAT